MKDDRTQDYFETGAEREEETQIPAISTLNVKTPTRISAAILALTWPDSAGAGPNPKGSV
ncbi:hypothetical protein [Desulfonema ishimotonii]|uniref:hypothetical protein n=1 Tax=Desulfonema ishimotonii TaxID=45657 RepID=UPI00140B6250|nr:hypothetical protein [Desulfonema ishimotonii]